MNIDPIQELKDINTDGTTIRTNKETGKMIIRLKQGISEKVMNEICFYLYMDDINIDEGSDKQFITEIRDAANYFQIERLEKMCQKLLGEDVEIPDSTWSENMMWVFENMRSGKYDSSDFKIVCRKSEDDLAEVKVPCHAVILSSFSKYFKSALQGDVDTDEKKYMEGKIDATESQVLSVLKFVYTKQIDEEKDDIVGAWIIGCKYVIEDLIEECEDIICENLNEQNFKDMKILAQTLKSERVLEKCEQFE